MQITHTPYDIIIIAGQSNAEGNGHGGTEMDMPEQVFQVYDKNPAYTSGDFGEENHYMKVTLPCEVGFGPAVERGEKGARIADMTPTFVKAYIDAGLLRPGRRLLIVKAAAGGTGFAKSQWGVGNALSERLIQMTDYALTLHTDSHIVALLWHQGEHDAFEQAGLTDKERYDFYVDNFTRQISLWRDRYGNFPMVCGGFVKHWASFFRAQCDAVEQAQRDSCVKLGNAVFVESEGLQSNDQAVSNGDNIHFCRESVYELGRRYFNAWQKICFRQAY